MKRYYVTTFGCQMNAHDSERIKGLLEELGLGEAAVPDEADVLVFNTCTIREKPDTRLAAHLGNARVLKQRDPELVIAVGGCYAEAQRERIFEQYPFIDVAFGPGSIAHLGDWIGAGGVGVPRGRFGIGEERAFAAGLPAHRERPVQAWVQISMGCNSVCSYCIVPSVRGREVSRRPGEVLAEVTLLAGEGVKEVTLLGQNVNSYGRDLGSDFAELLRAVDAVDGIERIRFTSPHPKDFRADVIAAMAECDAVCEHAHLPLQSGSTRLLKAMRRTYGRERYLRLVDDMRSGVPDLALTTDIIVGFPGETEEDFSETLEVWRRSATTAPSPSSTRRGPAPRPRPCPIRCPTSSRASGSSGWSRSSSGSRTSATRSAWVSSSRCWSRGQVGPIPRFYAAGRGGTRPSTSPAQRPR